MLLSVAGDLFCLTGEAQLGCSLLQTQRFLWVLLI